MQFTNGKWFQNITLTSEAHQCVTNGKKYTEAVLSAKSCSIPSEKKETKKIKL